MPYCVQTFGLTDCDDGILIQTNRGFFEVNDARACNLIRWLPQGMILSEERILGALEEMFGKDADGVIDYLQDTLGVLVKTKVSLSTSMIYTRSERLRWAANYFDIEATDDVEDLDADVKVMLFNGPAGGSGNRDIKSAIRKALTELYQAFVLTYQSKNRDKHREDLDQSTDRVTSGYLTFNTPETFNKFFDPAMVNLKRTQEFMADEQWLVDGRKVALIAYMQELKFGGAMPPLHYVATLAMPGFPLMTIEDRASEAEANAALIYGYSKQIRKGPLPFA